jgi:hypothetical protein
MQNFLSLVLAATTISPLSAPVIVGGSAIAVIAIATPAQANKFEKVKKIVTKVCEVGGCFYVVEQVVEYFQTSQNVSESPDMCSGKGCSTIRTGGNAVKVGETRTIIRKVRIR